MNQIYYKESVCNQTQIFFGNARDKQNNNTKITRKKKNQFFSEW